MTITPYDPFQEQKEILDAEAYAKKALAEAQLELDSFEAQCALDIRETCNGKITENAVRENVASNPDVVTLKKIVIEAQHAYDLAKVKSELLRNNIKYQMIALQQQASPSLPSLPRLY